MADIDAALDRMEGTVNDVLDFRKLDANMMTMMPTETHLASLVSSICKHRYGIADDIARHARYL